MYYFTLLKLNLQIEAAKQAAEEEKSNLQDKIVNFLNEFLDLVDSQTDLAEGIVYNFINTCDDNVKDEFREKVGYSPTVVVTPEQKKAIYHHGSIGATGNATGIKELYEEGGMPDIRYHLFQCHSYKNI